MPSLLADCLIVGGGVVGLSTAWELARRGLRCAVIDAAEIGRGCSWAGAGVFPAARLETARDPIDQLRGLSHELHPDWAARLQEATGIDNGYRKCGGFYLARSVGEAASLVGQASYWSEYEIAAEPVSVTQLGKQQPAIDADGAGIRAAWWVPDEAQLSPPDHLRALVAACRASGVALMPDTEIKDIVVENGRAVGVITGDGVTGGVVTRETPAKLLFGEHVVLACGAWAGRFAGDSGRVANVFPIRGQVVLYQARVGRLTAVINEGNRYLVPRENGVIYVGSNEEEVGWNEGVTEDVINSLKQWAETLIPELRSCPIIKTFSGLRPGSFDGFPFIGRSADVHNLYLATGHYRSGLHLSCGTAVLLADQITGQVSPISTTAFAVSR